MRWLALSLALLAAPAAAQPPYPLPDPLPDFSRLAREQAPAVVSIAMAYAAPAVIPDVPHDESFEDFVERMSWMLGQEFVPQALGSGFLIDAEGTILTGFHVVEEAYNDEVVVRLADGRELVGRVTGVDRDTDLALVKIEARGLPHVRIGDPGKLAPGQWVAIIGAPFGLAHSVAAGIVSAVGRRVPAAGPTPLIQTDVAMNPGHSGAPLFNAQGEVVGLNSLIFSNTGASIGLSFAIPIDVAMAVAAELLAEGRVTRGRIGVRLQAVSQELARAFRLPAPAGALVTQAEREGPAERAGIVAGDVIVRFDGRPVRTHTELTELITAAAPRSTVVAELLREGERLALEIEVAGAEPGAPRPRDVGGTDRLGLVLAPLREQQRRRLALEEGLLVHRAEGAARRAGIVPGDVILSVNGAGTGSLEAFRAAVGRALPGDSVALLVARAGGRAFMPLRVP